MNEGDFTPDGNARGCPSPPDGWIGVDYTPTIGVLGKTSTDVTPLFTTACPWWHRMNRVVALVFLAFALTLYVLIAVGVASPWHGVAVAAALLLAAAAGVQR